MNKLNFDAMSRDELAHFMVAHRDTEKGIEARYTFAAWQRKPKIVELSFINLNFSKNQLIITAIAFYNHIKMC